MFPCAPTNLKAPLRLRSFKTGIESQKYIVLTLIVILDEGLT